MGFDLTVSIQLRLDPKTGQPFTWTASECGKFTQRSPPDLSSFAVPENYRRFLEQRGGIFQLYVGNFDKQQFTMTFDEFLNGYPVWFDVHYELNVEDYGWKEKDHNEFKEFLEWGVGKGCYFINWSY